MKRKLLTMIISIAMVMSLTSVFAFAESVTTQVDTVAQLKKALGDDLSAAEKAVLMENAKEEIIIAFMEEKLDKAAEIINGQNFDVEMQTMPDGAAYEIQEFDLGDRCVMTVELSDCSKELSNGIAAVKSKMTADSSELWRAYGHRSFTAKASINFVGAKVNMILTNNYKLSSNGIDVETGKASCSWGLSNGQIDHGTPNITDGIARTPGASDVNMHCIYTLLGRGNNGFVSKAKYKLNTTIGYVAINKAEKKIKVRQSWSLSKVS